MNENKKTFKAEVDGKEIEMAVRRPDFKAQQKAQQAHNKAFREAVESGAIVRARVEALMRDQNLWDDKKQAEYEELDKAIKAGERKLAGGNMKLRDAREVAIDLRRKRWSLRQLRMERNELDLNTAEAQAENARFNCLVSQCTVYGDSGKPFYQSYEEYAAKENDSVGPQAALLLQRLVYGLSENYENELPENAFLSKYKFANKDLHLIDKQGRLINADGHLVDDNGRLINEKGEFVDGEGQLLTETGAPKVEAMPFLDDDGNPVVLDEPKAPEEKPQASPV